MKHFLNIIVVAIASAIYAGVHWYNNFTIVNWIMSTNLDKPFVYRQLVPMLVRGLSESMRMDVALILVVTLAGIGFYISLAFLGNHFGLKNELGFLITVLLGLLLFGMYRSSYDLMTAFLWTLALLFIFQHSQFLYAILFPIICLNRIETSIFLVGLWIVFYSKEWTFIVYQIVIFLSFYIGLYVTFSQNYGTSVWIEPAENLQKFLSNPRLLMLHISIFMAMIVLVLRNWSQKDYRLRRAFMVLLPVFLVLYVIFGQAFEIRVFWEMLPLVGIMMSTT